MIITVIIICIIVIIIVIITITIIIIIIIIIITTAGNYAQRKRCREFINWLLAQRRGSVTHRRLAVRSSRCYDMS